METISPSAAAEVDAASSKFVGQWRGLVSTTNWEKGRIIHEWRTALRDGGAGAAEWSDEAWSRRVGQVTPQHVGRLRRVYERFAAERESYAGLYWSHFQAALDWPNAEMWLEGAVQNGWSIGEMRARRWETLGAVATQGAGDPEVVESELDEDVDSEVDAALSQVRNPGQVAGAETTEEGSESAVPPSRVPSSTTQPGVAFDADAHDYPVAAPDEPVRPFAQLAELPVDLAEAFEAFKLAILRHKLAGWQEISRDDVLGSLDALKELVLAPAAG